MPKLLLALQYRQGDMQAALDNARLIADLEPSFRDDVALMFFYRNDLNWDAQQQATLDYVSLKMQTIAKRSTAQLSGDYHPHNCNQMWCNLMTELTVMRKNGGLRDYDYVFTMEADACPMRPGWYQEMIALVRERGKELSGYYSDHPPHINGNLIFLLDAFARRAHVYSGCPARDAWDIYFWPSFARDFQWHDNPLMVNMYRKPTITEVEAFGMRPGATAPYAMIHGVRDDSCRRIVRQRFLSGISVNTTTGERQEQGLGNKAYAIERELAELKEQLRLQKEAAEAQGRGLAAQIDAAVAAALERHSA